MSLKFQYRSDDDDLVNDFYIPCLTQSIQYDRAVGYFIAEGLSRAARGVAQLIRNGGKMRLVVGALIREDDRNQILEGYQERLSEGLSSRLNQELEAIDSDVVRQRIASLAWLVANGKLEVKVAVRVDDEGKIGPGIYHEKMGCFKDEIGNVIAFTGSSNETPGGLVDNFESNEIYADWVDAERPRVNRKVFDFEKLWSDATKNLRVLDFTEAVKINLLRFKPVNPPDFDPEDRRFLRLSIPPKKRELYEFQKAAIASWQQNNFNGIFAMATGSGKTLTAIKAVEGYVPTESLTVVVVPTIEVASQWEKEIGTELPDSRIITAHSGTPNWNSRVETVADYYSIGGENEIGRTFVVVTYDTASTQHFLNFVSRVPGERLCLICDEVHHAGAPVNSKILGLNARFRLALSATYEREWDELGTDLILNYFRGVVYTYEIGMAVEQGYLCPYEYFLHPVALAEDELETYRALTKKVSALIASKNSVIGSVSVFWASKLAGPNQVRTVILALR